MHCEAALMKTTYKLNKFCFLNFLDADLFCIFFSD